MDFDVRGPGVRLGWWLAVPAILMALSLPALADNAYRDGEHAFARKDYADARTIWQPLAEAGDARAQYGLGLLSANGWGVERDALATLHWYTVAAERGHPGAQYNLAVMRDRGDGVPRDAAQAAFWYGEAARQGVSSAAYNLALMTLAGDGLKRDPAKAMAWLDRVPAADRAGLIAALPQAQVRVASANVRAMPTQAGEIIDQVRRGRDLRVFSHRGAWAEVWLAGDQGAPDKVGWIASRLLDGPAARKDVPVRLDRFEFGPLTALDVHRRRDQGRATVATVSRGRSEPDNGRLLRNSGWLAGVDRVDFADGNLDRNSDSDAGSSGKSAGDMAPADANTMRVATEVLNVRAAPSSQSAVITRLRHGERVQVIGRRSGWRRIQLPEGPGSGWAASFLLAPYGAPAEVEQPGRAARIGGKAVNVRAAPSTDAAVLGQLSRGEPVRVIESRDGWRRLRINGQGNGQNNGWVAAFLIAGEVTEQPSSRAARVGQSGG